VDDKQEEARRWVRRKRRFYTILVVYLALSLLWLVIDMLTGTDDLWFYWPVFGAGVIVAVIGIAMFGLGGLFPADWERRQVDQYLQRRGPGEETGSGHADHRPPPG
jgi:polyferredoxin